MLTLPRAVKYLQPFASDGFGVRSMHLQTLRDSGQYLQTLMPFDEDMAPPRSVGSGDSDVRCAQATSAAVAPHLHLISHAITLRLL
jgi:hypothetical protein